MKKKAIYIRVNKSFAQKVAFCLAVTLFVQAIMPTAALALTSGPSQPEFTGFSPIQQTEMVDLFSGDFSYNIPLLEVPGSGNAFPLSLSYHSVTNIEEEASWVGLGWNLNIGAINRQVRGIPDDFNGEEIGFLADKKPNWTASITGSSSFELIGLDAGVGIDVGLKLSLMYNNYEGIGWKIGMGPSIQLGKSPLSASFDFGLNSFSGSSLGFGLDYSKSKTTKDIEERWSYGVGASINNISGFQALNFSYENIVNDKPKLSQNSSAAFNSFAFPATLPSFNHATTGFNFSAGTTLGLEFLFFNPHIGVNASFSTQKLKNRFKAIRKKTYGSMYAENGQNGEEALMDFNRHHIIPAYKKLKNLAYPNMTNDLFSVSGQGLSGSFSLHRSDIGIFKDPRDKSGNAGVDLGIDLGGGLLFKIGNNAAVNGGRTINFPMEDEAFLSDFKFQTKTDGQDFEPYYYKMNSSMTGTLGEGHENEAIYDNPNRILGNAPLKFVKNNFDLNPPLQTNNNIASHSEQNTGKRNKRAARAGLITEFTQGEITDNETTYLPAYDVQYKKWNDTAGEAILPESSELVEVNLNRNVDLQKDKDKLGGFSYLSATGDKLNFALPAMNFVQKDVDFSIPHRSFAGDACPDFLVTNNIFNTIGKPINYENPDNDNGSDNHLDIKRIPEYAHSFLLTSLLGQNYIDIDITDGQPNYKDKGGWMRFEYVKTSSSEGVPYKWRVPYYGANYNQGFESKKEDDSANYSYGEKEQFYVQRIVSATHEALFYLSKRDDGRGVSTEYQENTPSAQEFGAYKYKLDSIHLNLRGQNNDGKLIKSVHFDYDYLLCPGIFNNEEGTGKLTLQKVYFKTYTSNRGQLNPYEFTYFANTEPNSGADYGLHKSDRWGVLSFEDDVCANIRFPYTKQSGTDFETNLNAGVKAYHLSEISLPSGAKINIDIARDHYAYVQDRIATQMFKIAGVGALGETNVSIEEYQENGSNDFKVFFELETAINDDDPLKQEKLNRYFEDLYKDGIGKQIYFRIKSKLVAPTSSNDDEVFVNGFAYLKGEPQFAAAANGGVYNAAYFKVHPIQKEIRGGKYHPFVVSAWQLLKLNFRKLLLPGTGIDNGVEETNSSGFEKLSYLTEISVAIIDLFKGFYKRCIDLQYGTELNLDQSFIRLNSPDKIKYGGGVQVQKISITNSWDKEEVPEYGSVYDYTTTEEVINTNGDKEEVIISTGVAINEPSVGNEETAFRYGKTFEEDIIFGANNIYIQQMPYGEIVYPGAGVGYSQVRVRSLASDYNYQKSKGNLPQNGVLHNIKGNGLKLSSSGESINEFYTAKDYPVIERETILTSKTFSPRVIPIPFIGSITTNRYTGTQGYSVELNDMHGKPKKVSTYAQDKVGAIIPFPVSSVEYIYQDTEFEDQVGAKKLRRRTLDNNVSFLMDYANNSNPSIPNSAKILDGELGVERSLITDVRRERTIGGSIGVEWNVDVTLFAIFPAFSPSVIPAISTQKDLLSTGVTSKVIRKKGILKKVVAFDGQSKVETENLVFDPYTGSPLLNSVQNHFDDKVYAYTIPAYMPYKKMGPAYQNWKFSFDIDYTENPALDAIVVKSCSGFSKLPALEASITDKLVHGDEFFISKAIDGEIDVEVVEKTIATYMGLDADGHALFDANSANIFTESDGVFHFMIYRSGKRNQLAALGQSITALENPTTGYNEQSSGLPVYFSCNTAPSSWSIASVLDATANEYSEFWEYQPKPPSVGSKSGSIAGNKVLSDEDKNKYQTGHRGIYKIKSSYKYNSSRNNDDANVSAIKKQGIYKDFIFFNWDEPHFKYSANGSKWIPAEEITHYSENASAVESKNALGQYQAVLQSYALVDRDAPTGFSTSPPNGVTAQITNAEYFESAFTSFEHYDEKQQSVANKDEENYCHFDFGSDPKIRRHQHEVYTILDICLDNSPQAGQTFIIDKNFRHSNDIPSKAEIYITDNCVEKTYEVKINSISPQTLSTDFINFSYRNLSAVTLGFVDQTAACLMDFENGAVDARIAFMYESDHVQNNDMPSSKAAHTGLQTLSISKSNSCFEQNSLKLTVGKTYYFSCWVSRADNNTANLSDVSVSIAGEEFEPQGALIDGWQRVEGEFVYTNAGAFDICFNQEASFVYVDDVRIIPRNAEMLSYVYDVNNNRLSETLDNNNYFTRYIYNAAGEVVSVMKETERGVVSIQENRKHIKLKGNPNDVQN